MDQAVFKIDYEKHILENGLEVIVHEDHEDPVVAIAILYHVGSNRERPGKTGFAHFFEHMLFQNSEHVGKGNFVKMIEDAGGTMNGGTWQDGTIYYEVVPKNALDRILWLESDRMGYMINTVTQDVLDNEKEVVKNEKRQRVDNQPYGHVNDVIDKNLFPEGHPYSWQIIGSMEDLNRATIDDVKEFYQEYYGPNNATLVIAGDVDLNETMNLVNKYFAEIPARGNHRVPGKNPVILENTKKIYFEDPLISLPQLTLTFPTVEETHTDFYPLAFLGSILAAGKRAPLYRIIVEQKQQAPRVIAHNRSLELAGKFRIQIKANPSVTLNDVLDSIHEAFDLLLKEGIDARDIQKIKNAQEVEFYHGISNVLNKAFQLAQYNVFRGEPDKLAEEIKALMQVSEEDILRVFQTYIYNKPCVITSFVPKGKSDRIITGSTLAEVDYEDENNSNPHPMLHDMSVDVLKTPSKIDRNIIPPLAAQLELKQPDLWTDYSDSGINVLGIEDGRLPLIEFSIRWHGGLLLDDPNKIGVANAISDSMKEGTRHKTPEQLQDAINLLGANIQMYTTSEYIDMYVSTLSRNFAKTWEIVQEMWLAPRWDENEFRRIKKRILSDIETQTSKPDIMAGLLLKQKLYENHILSNFTLGSKGSIQDMTLSDLQSYYQDNFHPGLLSIHAAGNLTKGTLIDSSNNFLSENYSHSVPRIEIQDLQAPAGNILYLIDQPGASQSVINVGRLGVKGNDPILDTLHFINYRLGGNFNSILNTKLREEKGYTYGVSSSWTRRKNPGLFVINTRVQSEVTAESLDILIQTLNQLPELFTDEVIDHTRQVILRSHARAFESLNQKINILEKIASYNLPLNYIERKITQYQNISSDSLSEVISDYYQPKQMVYIVVGDVQKIRPSLKKLGFQDIQISTI